MSSLYDLTLIDSVSADEPTRLVRRQPLDLELIPPTPDEGIKGYAAQHLATVLWHGGSKAELDHVIEVKISAEGETVLEGSVSSFRMPPSTYEDGVLFQVLPRNESRVTG